MAVVVSVLADADDASGTRLLASMITCDNAENMVLHGSLYSHNAFLPESICSSCEGVKTDSQALVSCVKNKRMKVGPRLGP